MTLLPADAKKMLFTSRYPVDKILGIFEGSFTASATVFASTRTNEAFDHNLATQVFLQMTFSTDGGTTWQDQHISKPDLSVPTVPVLNTVEVGCYSTTTQIVIVASNFTLSDVTVTYKVVAFAI